LPLGDSDKNRFWSKTTNTKLGSPPSMLEAESRLAALTPPTL
jgi:hypothetical protein